MWLLLNSAGRCSASCDQTGSRRRPNAVDGTGRRPPAVLGCRGVPPDHHVGVGPQPRDVVDTTNHDVLLGELVEQLLDLGPPTPRSSSPSGPAAEDRPHRVADRVVHLPGPSGLRCCSFMPSLCPALSPGPQPGLAGLDDGLRTAGGVQLGVDRRRRCCGRSCTRRRARAAMASLDFPAASMCSTERSRSVRSGKGSSASRGQRDVKYVATRSAIDAPNTIPPAAAARMALCTSSAPEPFNR